jgi:hypothetical protein
MPRTKNRCGRANTAVGTTAGYCAAADQLDGKVGEQIGEPGDVVAGVGHNQDLRVAGLSVTGHGQALDHRA